MSRSETTPPNSVGRLSSLAAIRELTAAVELTDWYLGARVEPVLRKGSIDPAVRDLQEALKALGHDPGPVDGVFGATTEAAVKAFQQAKDIAVDGIVGRVTWINIDEADQSEPVLKIGSTGLPVRRAQKRMRP
jgi:peptidoglycan hydrolase-like protein with peptidoglycan-binding domain